MKERQQSTTTYPLVFLLVSSTDHVSGVTGATVTVTLSKNGGAFASASGTVTEVGNGWYSLGGSGLATDLGTLGPIVLHATATGADPTDSLFTVVPWNPFDGTRMGLTALPNAAAAAAGGLLTYGSSTGQINPSGGIVPSDVQTIKTQTVTCAAGVTFPASIGTSTYAGGAVASVTGAVGSVTAAVTVGTNNDKTGYALASTGLDSISVTAPAGVATTFPGMVVQTWRRFFRKATKTSTQIKTYADDGATVVTTQAVSDDGTTQTQGAAS